MLYTDNNQLRYFYFNTFVLYYTILELVAVFILLFATVYTVDLESIQTLFLFADFLFLI